MFLQGTAGDLVERSSCALSKVFSYLSRANTAQVMPWCQRWESPQRPFLENNEQKLNRETDGQSFAAMQRLQHH